MGEERAHEVRPLSEEILQLLAAWGGGIPFIQGCGPWEATYAPVFYI